MSGRRKHFALNETLVKSQDLLDQLPKVAFTARFSDDEEKEVNHQPHIFDNPIECDACGQSETELFFIPTARASKCYAVEKATGWRFIYPPGWVCKQCADQITSRDKESDL